MVSPNPLVFGQFYHIYNRGTNRESIFREDHNYRYFLQLYIKHIYPIAETFAYCLLRNHFHVLVRIRTEEEQIAYRDAAKRARTLSPSRQFGTLFSAYARAFNKAYERTGSLFQHPFKRVPVVSDAHLTHLVIYLHRDSQRHGLVEDFRDWTYSSYHTLLWTGPTRLAQDEVLGWFQGRDGYLAAHLDAPDEGLIAPLVAGDSV